eukprot:2698480-Ditylum_brightwellii.AAC.1
MSIVKKTKEEKEVLATEEDVNGVNKKKVSDTSSDSVLSLVALSSNATSKSYSQHKSKESLDAFSEDMTELVDEINQ